MSRMREMAREVSTLRGREDETGEFMSKTREGETGVPMLRIRDKVGVPTSRIRERGARVFM